MHYGPSTGPQRRWRDLATAAAHAGASTYPVTLALLFITTLLTIARAFGPAQSSLVDRIAQYRAEDLADGRYWRLPASALLAQDWLQLVWTLVVGGALFLLAEKVLGSIRLLLVLVIAHVVPTVVIAGWAETDHPASLHTLDYGTSCLIIGAAAALIASQRLVLLAVATAATFGVDALINSPVTITEHVIALVLGLTLGWWTSRRAGKHLRYADSAVARALQVARLKGDGGRWSSHP
jgi:membrane associated rhomboid family serine protease